ncbi:MAG: N-acetylmuramoyl-L-alanine amidase [Myxococcota bacterium]
MIWPLRPILLWLTLATPAAQTLPLVAIDPGHGGEHDGALGICGLKEKNVALAVSLELGRILETSGRARVFLTRTDDSTLELRERANLANHAGADLFVSVHANASTSPHPNGVETYFLSHRSSDRRSRSLVMRENEGQTLPSANTDDPLSLIIDRLHLNAAHHESQRLAMRLQTALQTAAEPHGRAVLQAPFIVLLETKMAAALIEMGFLSNEDECLRLGQIEHQRRLARSLASGILVHLTREEGRSPFALSMSKGHLP